MEQSRKPQTNRPHAGSFDLDALLHPARAFARPMDVVRDVDLTLNEKRAILASWASDACAVEAMPEMRINAAGKAVRWDDIMDALRVLDRQDTRSTRSSTRKWWRMRRWRDRTGGESDHGPQVGL